MTENENEVIIRAIKSRITELECLQRRLGINYSDEIGTLKYVLDKLTLDFRIVSRETLRIAINKWLDSLEGDAK